MKRSDVDRNLLSPMMMQYMDIKDTYEPRPLYKHFDD